MLWSLLIGALIGALGARLASKSHLGCLFNIIAGLLGSYVGQALFGEWGPKLADMALIPSVLGSAIVIIVVSYIFDH